MSLSWALRNLTLQGLGDIANHKDANGLELELREITVSGYITNFFLDHVTSNCVGARTKLANEGVPSVRMAKS